MNRLCKGLSILLLFWAGDSVYAQNKMGLDTDLACLAMSIFHEARGEITTAEIAVAQLVMKRVDDERFPSSVCDVVKHKSYSKKHEKWICAFDWYCKFKGVLDLRRSGERDAWKQSVYIAKLFLSDNPPVLSGFEDAVLFHDDSIPDPWSTNSNSVRKLGKIDSLIFYSE